jgi:hypothetical protein
MRSKRIRASISFEKQEAHTATATSGSPHAQTFTKMIACSSLFSNGLFTFAGCPAGDAKPGRPESMRSKRLRASVPFEKQGNPTAASVAGTPGSSQGRLKNGKSFEGTHLSGEKRSGLSVGLGVHSPAFGSRIDAAAPTVPQALAKHHPVIVKYMTEQGFLEPTPVQAKVWAEAGTGNDVIAQVCQLCPSHGPAHVLS